MRFASAKMHTPFQHTVGNHALVELASRHGAYAFFMRGFGRAFFIVEENNTMPDYAKLYHLMVNAAEDALAALENANIWDAKRILIEAEQRAEELYIQGAEETVTC